MPFKHVNSSFRFPLSSVKLHVIFDVEYDVIALEEDTYNIISMLKFAFNDFPNHNIFKKIDLFNYNQRLIKDWLLIFSTLPGYER